MLSMNMMKTKLMNHFISKSEILVFFLFLIFELLDLSLNVNNKVYFNHWDKSIMEMVSTTRDLVNVFSCSRYRIFIVTV